MGGEFATGRSVVGVTRGRGIVRSEFRVGGEYDGREEWGGVDGGK